MNGMTGIRGLMGLMGLWMVAVAQVNLPASSAGGTVRVKDIASVHGIRSNQLTGYGLVVGLEGTGDSNGAQFTVQSIANMLERFGVSVSASDLKVKNVAAVIVTADLPAYTRRGATLDVTVSSLGDARSLQGGTLLQTPLHGANGKVYAVAQGAISIGGFNFSGGGGNRVQKNHTTVGRVPAGAIVENEVSMGFVQPDNSLVIRLHQPDFTTASRIASTIREQYPLLGVSTPDPGTVRVSLPPEEREDPVLLISQLENLRVQPDVVAKIIVNERTGTVVVNGDVRIAPVAIAHGGITVRVQTRVKVSQPPPLSPGETVPTPETEIGVEESEAKMIYLSEGGSVESLVKALNLLGVTPRDLIAILQAIKGAGALHAEIEVQ